MTQSTEEVNIYTRDDMLQALAETLDSSPDDHRIADAYDQVISERSLLAADPEAEYSRFFQDGFIATEVDLLAVKAWAKGRILI